MDGLAVRSARSLLATGWHPEAGSVARYDKRAFSSRFRLTPSSAACVASSRWISAEEARRYVLEGVMAGDLRASQAAEILGISERHAWRLLAAYRTRGAAALEHGNRGAVRTTPSRPSSPRPWCASPAPATRERTTLTSPSCSGSTRAWT